MKSLVKFGRIALINVLLVVLLLALLEGGASLLFTAYQVVRTPGLAEQSYSRYDETLGWVSLPNANAPDLYGPGVYLRTNSQGFRNDRDFARAVPVGKIRIVCSGDSFTLGFGVSNAQAWCERLGALDPRLETVNMGQGGYGLDQAYLWYVRAGAAMDQQVHLFAFITDDFIRMESDRFLGYGKPILGLRSDSIVVLNRPVPTTSWFTRWRAVKGHALGNLNMVRLVQKILRLDERTVPADTLAARMQRTQGLVTRIFENLARMNREKGSRLVLVYLPGPGDYRTNDLTSKWRRFVESEAQRQGIVYLDVVDALRKVPPTDVNELFSPNSHYSVAGNEFVANTVYKALGPLIGTRE